VADAVTEEAPVRSTLPSVPLEVHAVISTSNAPATAMPTQDRLPAGVIRAAVICPPG
jgi:hypothetical protein